MNNDEIARQPNWKLFLVTLLLLSFGVVMVFDASYAHAFENYGDNAYWFKKQLISAVVGLGGLFLFSRIRYWKLQGWAFGLMACSLILLVAVRFVGHHALGAQRAIGYGPLKFQPSELAKLALVLYAAHVLTNRPRTARDLWTGIIPFMIVPLTAIFLVERQPDLGTAVTMLLGLLAALYVAGARARWLAGFVAAFALAGLALTLLHSGSGFRSARILAFLNPEAAPRDAAWQINHSSIALGTGGVLGVGFGESREKKPGNLPMQRTDFIYAIVGEEFGLIGTIGLLAGFFVLAMLGCDIAYKTKDPFGALLAIGITSMITVQALLNIAVVTGSVPTTGIPLPFISYGGSSLVVTLVSIGILLNISKYPDREDMSPAARRAREQNGWRSGVGYHHRGGSANIARQRLLGY